MGYKEVYAAWKDDPGAFWMEAAEAIDWTTKPTRALDDSNPPFYKWFADGEANTCYNCVDRHVERGRGDQPAFIYDSPITGAKRTITYAELKDEVSRVAGALTRRGAQNRKLTAENGSMVHQGIAEIIHEIGNQRLRNLLE